jgi:hypothetical protein
VEEFLAWKVAHLAHDAREFLVAHADRVLAPAFAAKAEAQRVAADADMVILQRREPVRLVLLGVLFVTDADHRRFEQGDDGRENLFAR